jgi:protoporphyrin/coproporphyrin ferrochelatase
MTSAPSDGVLLVAHGTVERLDELPEFLLRIRHGRPASPELIAELVRRYQAIGGSPLLEITRGQAAALAERLGVPVLVGMRLWSPSVEDALRQAADQGLKRLAVLPLAPFSVHVYWQAAVRSQQTVAGELGVRAPLLVPVEAWGEAPDLVAAQARAIEPLLAGHSADETALVLSFHSLPARVIEAGDPYRTLAEAAAGAVARKLGRAHDLAFQSQGADGGAWVGPDLPTVFERVASAGHKRVVVAPIGFLAEHVETLYDLDIEAKGLAEQRGLVFERAPALNTDAGLIAAMAGVAERALSAAGPG